MKLIYLLRIILVAAVAFGVASSMTSAAAAVNSSGKAGQALVYVGTYTGAKSKGIYLFRLDTATGALTSLGLAGETVNPSWVTIHPNHRFLYAAGEIARFGGKASGAVSAFSIHPETGKLTLLNQQPSVGTGPCHLTVDASGKTVLVANYGGGSIAALSIREDGHLGDTTAFIQHTGSGANRQRQEAPHAHGIYLDAANRFALVPDLGLDKVQIYRFDAAHGTLAPNDPPSASLKAGSGPRHLAMSPNGRHAYVISEIACTMTAFEYDSERGALREVQTISTLPENETVKPGFSTAEVFVHRSGKFLYGSNRGHNTIAVYALDEKSGKMTHLENVSTQGRVPRGFGIDPSGSYLLVANQDSSNLVLLRIDPTTGRLTPTGQTAEAPMPVSVAFLPIK